MNEKEMKDEIIAEEIPEGSNLGFFLIKYRPRMKKGERIANYLLVLLLGIIIGTILTWFYLK